ncbi:ras-domain-containing protein [Tothia fuscella]|uniref:Ras-domain-containing protein n=1 Tax=Tothia fuscella TaxID=1048955 RepID=A0A9P4NJP5_9PEZI|nr:ras-domain-containing protein [Tothia fuscella]
MASNPTTTATTSQYDYLRRGTSQRVSLNREPSLRDNAGSPKPGPRTAAERISNGTVASTMSNNTSITMSSASGSGGGGRESLATQMTDIPAYSKKLVVVGDGGCGKTCLLISYAEGHFPEKYVPTVFENYMTTTTHPPTGKAVELALWDTAGQEEYDRLRPLSYPETDLLFVCFAIDCPNSLENVMDKWYPEVLHFCPTTPLILCGLKSDLRHKKTCIDLLKTQGLTPVTPGQGQAVANKMGAKYMECSSKENIGVEEIFDEAVCMIVREEEEEKDRFSGGTGSGSGSGSSGGGSAQGGSRSGRGSGLSGGGKRSKRMKKGGCKFL